jgi:RNA polymerase sigma factor (sigma-70 family)
MLQVIRFDQWIRDGVVADQEDLARLGHVTRARVTQIMNLLQLAPDLQEQIVLLPYLAAGCGPRTERQLRPIAATLEWRAQRKLWAEFGRGGKIRTATTMLIADGDWHDHNGCMSEVTRILSQIDAGDPKAAEQLLPLVYDELRKLAAAKLAQEKPGQTLQATALVHEAYLRLVGEPEGGKEGRREGEGSQNQHPSVSPSFHLSVPAFNSRAHFFAAAAEAMRRILIQSARRRNAQKRGGQWERIELDPALLPADQRHEKLLALDEALVRLQSEHPDKAQLLKLRFFAGMTNQEAAGVMGISSTTADRHWAYARAWLQREIASGSSEQGGPRRKA